MSKTNLGCIFQRHVGQNRLAIVDLKDAEAPA